MDLAECSAQASRFMLRLAEHIRPHFPQYAGTLVDQVQGKKMTDDRWNACAAILSSLGALPGVHFSPDEHDARNPALSSVVVAKKMATLMFGIRIDVPMTIEFVIWLINDIDGRLDRFGKKSDGQEQKE